MKPEKGPGLLSVLGELLSPLEFARLAAAAPLLAAQPRGQGQAVLVLPGFGASDGSTYALRRYLEYLGYEAQGWGLGRNEGRVPQYVPQVIDRVRALYAQRSEAVRLVGWSLGGVIAREVAREQPALVQQVITLGSPVVGGPKYTSLRRAYESRGVDLDALEAMIAAREARPITVPLTSVYSRRDGVVSWQASIDRHNRQTEHVEVNSTHLGLGISPEVFCIIAERLSPARQARAAS